MSGDRLVMVSEWMVNGNIDEYMVKNPDADRLELVCFSFMNYILADR